MGTYIHDEDGDSLRITKVHEGKVRLTINEDRGNDVIARAAFGRVDPHELIEAIKRECDLHEDDPIHHQPRSAAHVIGQREAAQLLRHAQDAREDGEKLPVEPDTVEALVEGATSPDDAEPEPEETGDPEPTRREEELAETRHLATQRRVQLAVKRDQRRAKYEDRVAVVQEALAMLPPTGKRGGIMSALTGEGGEPQPIEKALKVARFVCDPYREIPGVDK